MIPAIPSVRHMRVQGDGLSLQVTVTGDGPPVILLHGFPESPHSWRRQILPLASAGYSVWTPSLRGYPPSDIPHDRRGCSLKHLVEDIAALVAATGYARAHVVGHDWGGIIAWAFAGSHPRLLDKLVIMNAPHMAIYQKKLWVSAQALRSAYIAFFQLPYLPERLLSASGYRVLRNDWTRQPCRSDAFDEHDIEQYIQVLSQPGALKAALDYYRENIRPGNMALASKARTERPALILWGEQDPFLGTHLLEGLDRFAPRVHVHRIRGASHWVQNEAPDEVNRVMLAFLRCSDPDTLDLVH